MTPCDWHVGPYCADCIGLPEPEGLRCSNRPSPRRSATGHAWRHRKHPLARHAGQVTDEMETVTDDKSVGAQDDSNMTKAIRHASRTCTTKSCGAPTESHVATCATRRLRVIACARCGMARTRLHAARRACERARRTNGRRAMPQGREHPRREEGTGDARMGRGKKGKEERRTRSQRGQASQPEQNKTRAATQEGRMAGKRNPPFTTTRNSAIIVM